MQKIYKFGGNLIWRNTKTTECIFTNNHRIKRQKEVNQLKEQKPSSRNTIVRIPNQNNRFHKFIIWNNFEKKYKRVKFDGI